MTTALIQRQTLFYGSVSLLFFKNQKTKTTKQKPLVKHSNMWSLRTSMGIKSFPLVQKRLTLFIGLYNEFLCFLGKSWTFWNNRISLCDGGKSTRLSIWRKLSQLGVNHETPLGKPNPPTDDMWVNKKRWERRGMTTGIHLCVILSIFHTFNTCSYIIWTPLSACRTARAINHNLEDRYGVGSEHTAH